MSADLGLMPHLDLPQPPPLNPPGPVGYVGYTPTPPLHHPTGVIPAPIGTPLQPAQTAQVIDYGVEFPALEQKCSPASFAHSPVAIQSHNNNNNVSNWPKSSTTRKIASSTVTQVFHLPAEERRHHADQRPFGDKNLEQEDCNVIMKETGEWLIFLYWIEL